VFNNGTGEWDERYVIMDSANVSLGKFHTRSIISEKFKL
jgi:hypothetical protein